MGKRAFKGILNEVVGRLLVTAQQCAGEPAQPGICFSIRAARSGIASPFERRLQGSHHNARPVGAHVPSGAAVPVGMPAIIATVAHGVITFALTTSSNSITLPANPA
jgi:hypothetical protein